MTTNKVPRTYRLKPETLDLMKYALDQTSFKSNTALIEEAVSQFSRYILENNNHSYKKD